MQILAKTYQTLLKKIEQTISQTKENVIKTVNYQKVKMSWEIGREIDLHLEGKDKATYGKELFLKLAKDIKIEKTSLYQMHSFYKAYPKLPSENKALSWSHYRNLIAIKSTEDREILEDLVVTKSLGSDKLQQEIAKRKEVAKKRREDRKAEKSKTNSIPKLRVNRGQLFTYTKTKDGEIDLGFNVLLSSKEKISAVKKSDYTYIAKLERVVDGDTLHVKLDLGFGVFHHEILRLAKIDAAEAETKEGKKATAGLKNILKDVKFLVVKTNKTDIYGRYVADVFFDKKEKNPNKVAASGLYLNQMLLDKNLVNLWK